MDQNTSLQIKVDAKQLSGLDRMLQKIFGKQLPKGFNDELKKTNDSIKVQRSHLEALNKQLGQVKQGTANFKALKQAIKESGDEISRLSRIQSQQAQRVQQQQRSVALSQQHSIGRYAGGAASGVPGMAGGAMTGGVGGLAAGLAALPLGMGISGGMLMSAAAHYGSALSHQHAQMQAAPFLMSTRARQGRATGGPGISLYEQWKRGQAPNETAAFLGAAQSSMNEWGTSTSMMALSGGGSWLAAKALSGIMNVGPEGYSINDLSGVTAWEKAIAAAKAGGGGSAPGMMFSPGAYAAAGRGFGLDPTASLQQASAMAQAAGRPTGAGDFMGALGLQARFGIGVGQSGSYLQASRLTGEAGGMDMLADLIGQAVASNLEAGEIGQILSEQTSWLSAMYQAGSNVSQGGLTATAADLQANGVSAMRAFSVARQFGGGVANTMRSGPRSGLDLRLMSAAGYTGTGGWEEYSKYKMMLQDPGMASTMLPALLQNVLAGVEGPWTRANLAQGVVGAYGGTLDADSALALGNSKFAKGKIVGGSIADIISQGLGVTEATGGLVIGEAGLQAKRIQAGMSVAPSIQALESASISVTQAFEVTLMPAILKLSEGIDSVAGKMLTYASSTDIRK